MMLFMYQHNAAQNKTILRITGFFWMIWIGQCIKGVTLYMIQWYISHYLESCRSVRALRTLSQGILTPIYLLLIYKLNNNSIIPQGRIQHTVPPSSQGYADLHICREWWIPPTWNIANKVHQTPETKLRSDDASMLEVVCAKRREAG